MGERARGLLPTAALTWLIAWAPAAPAGPAAGLAPPRVRPLASRPVAVRPWEAMSVSPFGNSSRWGGGDDDRNFVFSPDGKLLAGEDAGGWQLELWDVGTGKSLGRFGKIDDPVALAFSADGKLLATASATSVGLRAVEVWDVAGRKRLRDLDGGVNVCPFSPVAFAPDGRALALAPNWVRAPFQPALHLWDAASGDEVRRLDGPPAPAPDPDRLRARYIDCLAFSPDGRSLALVSDRQVLLWEVPTGRERCRLAVLPPLYRGPGRREPAQPVVAFAPDGRALAAGCADGLVRLWDTLTGKEWLPLAGHRGAVVAVQFSPDGKTLWSFGRDNQVLTWPVAEARREWRPGADGLPAPALAALWGDLGGEDRLALHGAVRALAASPDRAVPLLRHRLRPVPAADSRRVAQLVADLAKDDYNERKRAAVELRKFGDLAIPALRKQEPGARYEEVRRHLLQRLEAKHPTPGQVRALHALEVLERVGTAEARRLLGELAKGAPESLLTRHAAAALERLRKEEARPTGATPEALWADLAAEDARRAFRALRELAARKGAVPFLSGRLRGLAATGAFDDSPARVARLVADLDSGTFATREKATKELSRLGKPAEAALRKALDSSPSPEVRRRALLILENLRRPTLPPERLRAERALEALERVGTEEARRALGQLGREPRLHCWKGAIDGARQRLARQAAAR